MVKLTKKTRVPDNQSFNFQCQTLLTYKKVWVTNANVASTYVVVKKVSSLKKRQETERQQTELY